jgi:hypothetical protein
MAGELCSAVARFGHVVRATAVGVTLEVGLRLWYCPFCLATFTTHFCETELVPDSLFQ